MKLRQSRRVVPVKRMAAVACVLMLSGCATNPQGQSSALGQQFKNTFASDDPCSNNARNIGVASGVVLGALLGRAMGDGKAGAVIGGGLVGGLVGGLIGSDMDRKRCELSKVAKKYELDIRFAPIAANGDVLAADAASAKSQPKVAGSEQPVVAPEATIVGTSLTVRDKDGVAGHFEPGSDQLSPKAREYFAAIAAQYTAAKMLEGQSDAKQKDAINRQVAQRRLFLIGHTDDTGQTQLNAALSERRARSVAAFLKQQGISEDSLYFQGAGETQPIADNRSESGRAANRRVELLELVDEASFEQFLAARKPNYQFYRPHTSASVAPAPAQAAAGPAKPAAQSGGQAPRTAAAVVSKEKAKSVARAEPLPAAGAKAKTAPGSAATATTDTTAKSSKAEALNFGGQPYSRAEASLNLSSLPPTKSGFSFVSTAQADESVALSDCTQDRPRAAGLVRSLKDGRSYKTNEHLPQLYGKTWAGEVNGHLLVINRLAVLKDGAAPANLPELKVYGQYQPGIEKKPEVSEEPAVNTYRVSQGLLYRMFPRGDAGLRCVDVLFATEGATQAKAGKIIYGDVASSYVANFKPRLQ